ncbi:MAG: putative hydrolase [Nocardia sp.]|uniref:cysteine hydrolase n=1 Tax=Nocardia sp. TaxID=1821 RepID=UPI00261B73BD|nr:cysteine hydrolase [Nocardia sp.]MCU1646132.1 putative hydrolase [Nocardia sp.]
MPIPIFDDVIAPGRTALVLQEIQNGVVGPGTVFPELAAAAVQRGVVDNAARLSEAARAASVPVIHATAESLPGGFGTNRNARLFSAARKAGADNTRGTASVRPVSAVYAEGDLVLPRYHGLSPLADGQLDALLRNSGITTVVIAGVSLNVAIPNLVFDAVNRSYRVVVITDAVAGVPVEYGLQVVEHTIGLVATLAKTNEAVHVWDSAAGRT